MGWSKIGLGTGLMTSMLAVGCQNKLYDQNKALLDENRALRDQNDQLRHQTPPAPAPVVAQQPAPPTETPVAQAPPQRQAPVEQIGGLETTVNLKTGDTTVHLPSDVFFDAGQATLKQSAKASLDKVVAALKRKFAAKALIVEGHTDSQPIRVSKWSSNMELSIARADAVKQYLVSHGVSASRISTKGFGDTHPRGSEMSRNRRVEIVVLTGD